MLRSRRLPVLLATLVLGACPSAALGQSAGDDQYEDPFGDEAPEAQPTPAPQSTPAPPAGPAPTAAAAQSGDEGDDDTAAPAPAASPTATGDELPRTGADAGLLASTGALLLVGGVALRLRLRARPA